MEAMRMSGELFVLRWEGVFELVGSGALAVLVAGVVACVFVALWCFAGDGRGRRS
jgi:hypothetical protein